MRLNKRWVCVFLAAVPLAYAEAAPSVLADSTNAAADTSALVSDASVSQVVTTESQKLNGVVSGFLKAEGSPYLVTETLLLPEGKALVIEAGVVLEFAAGAGFDVQGGSLAVVGSGESPVVMRAAPGTASWNGISVTGNHRIDFQHVNIQDAEVGVAVENGMLEMRNVSIEGTKNIGVYARAASVNLQWSSVTHSKGIAVWAGPDAYVDLDATRLTDNYVGVLAGEKSNVSLQTSKISQNEYGFVDMEHNRVHQLRSEISQNKVGLLANDVPADDLKKISTQNNSNLTQGVGVVTHVIPEEPRNPNAEAFRAAVPQSTTQDGDEWTKSGKVEFAAGYHHVKAHDENFFQVPGLFAELNAYLLLESGNGRSLEFSANLTSDTWNHFDPVNVLAVYTDDMQRIAVGNVFLSAGDIYLSGIDFLGASYDLSLFKNSAGEPLFVASAFGGETQKPKILGERNEDVYKDYIEDGEADPQTLMMGGKLRWNMHRRFNGTLGFIGSKDYLEDPLLRDGNSPNVNTASPLQSSKTFFADGNWLLFPGDVKLNGQVAVGAADTANATLQRAVNKVFVDAGLDASNLSKLRRLMGNPSLVDLLTEEELEEFFGDNSMMTRGEMQTKLKKLLSEAKSVKKDFDKKEESPAEIKSWDGQNFAFTGSLLWNLGNTVLSGYVRFVGSDFYSAGSPDLLQNSREVFGNLDQKIFDFWKLNFNYKIGVENAAHHSDYNVFGLAEGSKVGIVPGADDSWLEEHEQDESRTLHEHTINLNNLFKIGKMFEISAGYNMNYRTRSTNQRLYADYSVASGVYNDPWFSARKGSSTISVMDNNDTLLVDSARWAAYYALSDAPYLATQFDENIIRHTINLGVKMNMPRNVLKVGGIWTIRRDLSEFKQDNLLADFDFEDKTYGILGYYFHGGDYVEQRYPISLLTSLGEVRNMFMVTPRLKTYTRDNMEDFELTVSDNITVSLAKDFADVVISGTFRQEFLSRDEGDERIEESEMDLEATATLRFMHTGNLTSEWTLGGYNAYRPDYRADEYLDIFAMASINYSF